MKNRQHRSVGGRIEEFVAVPVGRKRIRFRLAVVNDAGSDQLRIIEDCAKSV
jgi:hypothetical protein